MQEPIREITERETTSLLLVEDEGTQRTLLKSLLEAEGYRVFAAEDGEEAMTLFAQSPGEIGLVISDLRMPGMDGYHMLLHMRRIRPAVKVMILSGHIDARIESDLLRGGATAVLQKPLQPTKFLEVVRQTLHQN